MALIDILRGKATIVKQETVEEANSAPRIGGLFEDIFDYIKDVLHIGIDNKVDKIEGKSLSTNDYDNLEKAEVAKVKDKVSFTIQELTPAQQAQARENIGISDVGNWDGGKSDSIYTGIVLINGGNSIN